MAKAKKTTSARKPFPGKKAAKRAPAKSTNAKPARRKAITLPASVIKGGPVTLDEARALAQAPAPKRTLRRGAAPAQQAVTYASVAEEREKLDKQIEEENQRRIREYAATMAIMKSRGVKGLAPAGAAAPGPQRRRGTTELKPAAAAQPLQIFAEGDSWFDYPVPFFGGGVVPRLERRLGVPILSLAKAGDEVRNMLGVEERQILSQQLRNGSPAGEPWDVLLFSGGGNDIVGNPMALWIQDFNDTVPPANLISTARFAAALALVRAGYEDLITTRDMLSPTTHLVFHGYDFAIPDGRGICGMGPWLKPTFDLRRFPARPPAIAVVKAMLQQFAAMLQSLVTIHNAVTFINTQGTLPPATSSWHNELHPSKNGFNLIAAVFHANLKTLFPGRVL
jgi:hypothetical protein